MIGTYISLQVAGFLPSDPTQICNYLHIIVQSSINPLQLWSFPSPHWGNKRSLEDATTATFHLWIQGHEVLWVSFANRKSYHELDRGSRR